MKRRSSMKSGESLQSQHELFERRRPSVPLAVASSINSAISYISTENVSRLTGENSSSVGYVIGECGHRRALSGAITTGYRCEKHGGTPRGHAHGPMLNGSSITADAYKRHKPGTQYDGSYNASSPSVPALLGTGYSDTG